jgi:MazG nucleotide pyrophosphohydrolase domain.
MVLDFGRLRTMNELRCARWHPGGVGGWSLSDWAVAMAGEAGEACNVVKKLNRERDSLVGNRETATDLRAALAKELADTVIYLDLLAAAAGIDLGEAVTAKFDEVSVKHGFPERLGAPASD